VDLGYTAAPTVLARPCLIDRWISEAIRFDGHTLVVRMPMRFRRRGAAIASSRPTAASWHHRGSIGRTARWSRRWHVRTAGSGCSMSLHLGQRDRRRSEHVEDLHKPHPAARAACARPRRRNPRGKDGSGNGSGAAGAAAAGELGGAANRPLLTSGRTLFQSDAPGLNRHVASTALCSRHRW
jgi:hypothetical protein